MSKRVTMKSIAERAGVSVMTVSLALRNSARISDATKQRVLELAKSMGFKPDPALGALIAYRNSQQSSSFLGTAVYLNNTDRPSIVEDASIHQNFFTGARERGKELGYHVEEFWLNSKGMTRERASDILSVRGIQGVFVGPQPQAHESLQLDWSRFTGIRLGHTLESPQLHTVAANQYLAVNLCFRELCKLGYSRIGLAISGEQDDRTQNRYTAAYLAMQLRLPEELPRIPVFIGKGSFDDFNHWMTQWQPDALIGPWEDTLEHLKLMKLRPGPDIGFAFPFIVSGPLQDFACAGVEQTLIGEAAMSHLNSLLMQNEVGIPERPHSLMLDPVWMPRKTVRRVGPEVRFRRL
ncbi:MAG: LacI family DNA-binding transcriptional regulator [Puniceicoccales bacterium]